MRPQCRNASMEAINEKTMFSIFKSQSDSAQPLIAVVTGKQVHLRKLNSKSAIKTYSYGGVNGYPISCQVSPDNVHVVAVTDNGHICISKTSSSGIFSTFGGNKCSTFGVGAIPTSASWIDNENLLVSTNKGRSFQFNIKTRKTKNVR